MWVGSSSVGGHTLCEPDLTIEGSDSSFYAIIEQGLEQPIVVLIEVDTYDPDALATRTMKYSWVSSAEREWRGKVYDTDFYRPTLTQPSNLSLRIFGGDPFGARESSEVQIGEFVVRIDAEDNADFTEVIWEGAVFRMFLGGIDFGLTEFQQIAVGKVQNIRYDEQELHVTIEVESELDVDIQTNTYDGMGDEGGTTDLANQKKPLCFGDVLNIDPVEVDPVFHIFQVHDGRVQEITAFDGGVDYGAASADFSSYAALKAWSPSGSEAWATALNLGLLRLRTRPAFKLTCDVKGDADTSLGGYVNRVMQIARRIILQRTSINASRVESVHLEPLVPYRAGLYLRDGAGSVHEHVDALLHPLWIYEMFMPTGQLRFGQIGVPAGFVEFQEHQIQTISRVQGTLHPSTYRMRFAQAYTVQRDTDLATGAPADRRSLVSTEFREEVYTSVGSPYMNEEPYEIVSLLADSAAAFGTAFIQSNYALGHKELFNLEVKVNLIRVLPGMVVKLTKQALGINGRYFDVLVAEPNFRAGTLGLLVWG